MSGEDGQTREAARCVGSRVCRTLPAWSLATGGDRGEGIHPIAASSRARAGQSSPTEALQRVESLPGSAGAASTFLRLYGSELDRMIARRMDARKVSRHARP